MGVRVEMKPLYRNASEFDKEKAFRGMLASFKRAVNESGVLTEYNRKQAYETKSQKKRRKIKESQSNLRRAEQERKEDLQDKIREHFGRG